MGMFLSFFLIVYILVARGVYKISKRFIINKWARLLILYILILIPTYDIIITNILGAYYSLSAPYPKTSIIKKVKYPISIYWEDNVYPGYNKEDRRLMYVGYLDGKHLKTMALNGDDGKIYTYHLDKPILEDIRKKYKESEIYTKVLDEYTQIILKTQKIYTKETMPKMNYTVTYNEIKLNAFSRKFLYSDEVKIIDNNTSEVIAYSRRYMPFFYHITTTPDFSTNYKYYSEWAWEVFDNGERVAHLEYKVFDAYKWSEYHFGSHKRNLHEILIKRNKHEGEK